MRVGELEGADCSAVPVPGMYSLANGENASWRRASGDGDGDGGIRLVGPSSAENVGGSVPYLRADLQGKARHLHTRH
jgi:hypothetical protein